MGLNESPAKAAESGTEWMRLVRHALLRRDVEFKADGRHYSLGLPREFRDLLLLPKTGEIAAILISGEIIEIWRGKDLLAQTRETLAEEADIIEAGLRQFQGRD